MSRARTSETQNWHTAASENNSGCLPGFLFPPLTVIFVGILLTIFTSNLGSAVGTPVSWEVPPVQTDKGPLSQIFTPEIQYWKNNILLWADQTGIEPNLIATIMQIESCGDSQAHSRAGAMGLFQVMPYHFNAGENPYNPDINALRGLGYLQQSITQAAGNRRLAMAGYNGGIGVISRAENTWAAETIRYVQYGWPIYEDAQKGVETSSALTDWYTRYGAYLCKQAATRIGIR
ncbi:MAG: transglycosylase SLT domain-containing protein [Anaerolineales bacterium]|nr:transglycosylase SLT domain-containing protein [Anaerolineales bacterium]